MVHPDDGTPRDQTLRPPSKARPVVLMAQTLRSPSQIAASGYPAIFCSSGGPKTINPMMADRIAATSTAPAQASLAIFAFSCHSGEARSTVASTAVFTSSSEKTRPIEKKTSKTSLRGICSHQAAAKTITAAATWICMFRCVFTVCPIPCMAYEKLLAILRSSFNVISYLVKPICSKTCS